MSDRPIQVGDLVQVVRTCCGKKYSESGGLTATVKLIRPVVWRCSDCGAASFLDATAEFNTHSRYDRAPLSWLKRIPPLSELESVQTDEKLTDKVSA